MKTKILFYSMEICSSYKGSHWKIKIFFLGSKKNIFGIAIVSSNNDNTISNAHHHDQWKEYNNGMDLIPNQAFIGSHTLCKDNNHNKIVHYIGIEL